MRTGVPKSDHIARCAIVAVLALTGACRHTSPAERSGFNALPRVPVDCRIVGTSDSDGGREALTIAADVMHAALPQCGSTASGNADILVQVALSEHDRRLGTILTAPTSTVPTKPDRQRNGVRYVLQLRAERARGGEVVVDARAHKTFRKPLDAASKAALVRELAQLVATAPDTAPTGTPGKVESD